MLTSSHRGGVGRKETTVDEENEEKDKRITRIEKKMTRQTDERRHWRCAHQFGLDHDAGLRYKKL
jgi:hypothetical protein